MFHHFRSFWTILTIFDNFWQFLIFNFFLFSYSEFFPVVLTPADLWYHTWFPRYRHLTLFVTYWQTDEEQEELRIIGVGRTKHTPPRLVFCKFSFGNSIFEANWETGSCAMLTAQHCSLLSSLFTLCSGLRPLSCGGCLFVCFHLLVFIWKQRLRGQMTNSNCLVAYLHSAQGCDPSPVQWRMFNCSPPFFSSSS